MYSILTQTTLRVRVVRRVEQSHTALVVHRGYFRTTTFISLGPYCLSADPEGVLGVVSDAKNAGRASANTHVTDVLQLVADQSGKHTPDGWVELRPQIVYTVAHMWPTWAPGEVH